MCRAYIPVEAHVVSSFNYIHIVCGYNQRLRQIYTEKKKITNKKYLLQQKMQNPYPDE